jgi:hypothetical protein
LVLSPDSAFHPVKLGLISFWANVLAESRRWWPLALRRASGS